MKQLKALLAMEDNEWREVFESILAPEVDQLVTTEDGLEAIEQFRRNQFDIVLIDESVKRASPAEVLMNFKDIKNDLPMTIVSGSRLAQYEKIWKHCEVTFQGTRIQTIKYLPWAIKDAQASSGFIEQKRQYN